MLCQSEHTAQRLVQKCECGRLKSPNRRSARARTNRRIARGRSIRSIPFEDRYPLGKTGDAAESSPQLWSGVQRRPADFEFCCTHPPKRRLPAESRPARALESDPGRTSRFAPSRLPLFALEISRRAALPKLDLGSLAGRLLRVRGDSREGLAHLLPKDPLFHLFQRSLDHLRLGLAKLHRQFGKYAKASPTMRTLDAAFSMLIFHPVSAAGAQLEMHWPRGFDPARPIAQWLGTGRRTPSCGRP